MRQQAADTWEREAAELGVTSANWLDAPYNRLGFRGVGRLVRTATISRGEGPVSELRRAERDLGGFRFEHAGRSLDLDTMLAETYTDGFLVIHDGAAVYERFLNGMAPSETHLLMSVSKSFNSTLCGVLVGQGVVSPEDLVTDHIEELRGTAWDGCTVQHLLDMRVGARWDYDVDEYTILDVSDYRTRDRTGIPADTESWIRTVDATHAHGGPFAYNSLANDVLGWVLERAGGRPYAELFSTSIWSAIGAEHDAEIMLDRSGFPIVEAASARPCAISAGSGSCASRTARSPGARSCPRPGWRGCSCAIRR
jgi:CubicO group peptidase (beta-lactamase class C family)